MFDLVKNVHLALAVRGSVEMLNRPLNICRILEVNQYWSRGDSTIEIQIIAIFLYHLNRCDWIFLFAFELRGTYFISNR